jgi:hypothetical protein
MVMSMKMAVFWNVALMMEALGTSETSVNFDQSTWCIIPEDSHLHNHVCVNLKFHMKLYLFALKPLTPLVDLLDVVRCEERTCVKDVGMS